MIIIVYKEVREDRFSPVEIISPTKGTQNCRSHLAEFGIPVTVRWGLAQSELLQYSIKGVNFSVLSSQFLSSGYKLNFGRLYIYIERESNLATSCREPRFL